MFVKTVDTPYTEYYEMWKLYSTLYKVASHPLNTKHIHMFLPITFLIFNWFSIRKKFWKAETEGFSIIPSILYMSILSLQDKDV